MRQAQSVKSNLSGGKGYPPFKLSVAVFVVPVCK